LLRNFFLTDDGNIGWGPSILTIAVIGIYVYRRGWRQTRYWLRQYIWCALVVAALVWLPFVTSPFLTTSFTTSDAFDILLFMYAVVIFFYTILVWLGVAIGAVLLARMLIPAKT
jgi:hypothetical protein